MLGLDSKMLVAKLYTYWLPYVTVGVCFFTTFKFAIPCVLCVLKNGKNFIFKYMKNYTLSLKLKDNSNVINSKRELFF